MPLRNPERLTVPVVPSAETTALVYGAEDHPVGAALILGHGAGAGQQSPWMVSFSQALSALGLDIVTFNFLQRQGAFARDSVTGKYRVNLDKMRAGMNALSEKILRLQGDGDYAGVGAFYTEYGTIDPGLRRDLDRLKTQGIPVDVIFEQGEATQPSTVGRGR